MRPIPANIRCPRCGAHCALESDVEAGLTLVCENGHLLAYVCPVTGEAQPIVRTWSLPNLIDEVPHLQVDGRGYPISLRAHL